MSDVYYVDMKKCDVKHISGSTTAQAVIGCDVKDTGVLNLWGYILLVFIAVCFVANLYVHMKLVKKVMREDISKGEYREF